MPNKLIETIQEAIALGKLLYEDGPTALGDADGDDGLFDRARAALDAMTVAGDHPIKRPMAIERINDALDELEASIGEIALGKKVFEGMGYPLCRADEYLKCKLAVSVIKRMVELLAEKEMEAKDEQRGD